MNDQQGKPWKLNKAFVYAAVRKILPMVIAGLVLGWGYDWAAPRLYKDSPDAGFWYGTVHGALMPAALPSLLMGQDVPIFDSTNQGRIYKVGYIAGINVCGLVFFGLGFRKSSKETWPGKESTR